jgi:hypothetical protein
MSALRSKADISQTLLSEHRNFACPAIRCEATQHATSRASLRLGVLFRIPLELKILAMCPGTDLGSFD